MSQLQAFALTIGIELVVAVVVAAVFMADAVASRRAWGRLLVAVVLASCLTHPILWPAAEALPREFWWAGVIAMEIAIGIIEGVVVAVVGGLGVRRGVIVGVAMNAISFGTGLALYVLGVV